MDNMGENKFDEDRFERKEAVSYSPPSNLKFDPEVKERFRSEGFYLKWINRDKIRKRMHPSEGYTLVSPEEFLPEERMMLGDTDNYGDAPIVTNGDLVLMKVRIEKAEARRDYYESKTRTQAEAIQRRLYENSIEHGGSKSVVRTGKQAHFSK